MRIFMDDQCALIQVSVGQLLGHDDLGIMWMWQQAHSCFTEGLGLFAILWCSFGIQYGPGISAGLVRAVNFVSWLLVELFVV